MLLKHKYMLTIIIGFVSLCFAAGSYWIMKGDLDAEQYVLKVNGAGVSIQEFEAAMSLERVGVIHEFQTKYEVEYDQEFWDKSFDGATPMEVLRERALERCISIKLQQVAAVETGVIAESDISYEGFLQLLKKENERRKQAVDHGEVIYGPQSYGEEEYFQYSFNNMIIRLKENLAKSELDLSPHQVFTFYNEHKNSLYKKPLYIRTKKLVVNNSPQVKEKAWNIAKQVKLEAERSHSLDQAADRNKDMVELSEQVFDETTARGDHKYATELLEAARELSPGEISNVITIEGGFAVLQGLERRDEGFYLVAEVQEDIMNRLLDNQYKIWLKKQRESAEVEINHKQYNKTRVDQIV